MFKFSKEITGTTAQVFGMHSTVKEGYWCMYFFYMEKLTLYGTTNLGKKKQLFKMTLAIIVKVTLHHITKVSSAVKNKL